MTLPDFRSIQNYHVDTDELGVTVEIANKKNYRYYKHLGPEWKTKEHEAAYKVVQILKLLKREFPIEKYLKLKISID